LEQQELYLLILRHLNAETTPEEEQWLSAWLEESTDHKNTYHSLATIWKADAPTQNNKPDALKTVKYKIRRRIYTRYAVAAATIGIIALSATFFFKETPYTQTSALAGQVRQVTLKDGTLVHLAPGSNIRYRNREVILDGEAFFDVTKDAHQPFTVKAGALTVNVLGTKFNVSDTAVSLVDGKVQVIANNHTYDLKPGEQLYKHNNDYYEREYDLDEVTGWKSSVLVFRNESFATAATRIEKMYDVKIVFTDPETASYRIFARFENKPLSYVMDVIKEADNLDYTIKGKTIYISKKQ
jgi:transmembrane sensor